MNALSANLLAAHPDRKVVENGKFDVCAKVAVKVNQCVIISRTYGKSGNPLEWDLGNGSTETRWQGENSHDRF